MYLNRYYLIKYGNFMSLKSIFIILVLLFIMASVDIIYSTYNKHFFDSINVNQNCTQSFYNDSLNLSDTLLDRIERLDVYDDGNFIVSTNPAENRFNLKLHQHIVDSLLLKSDEDIVFINFIPENKSNATIRGSLIPGDSSIKYSLRKIFESDKQKDWTGDVMVILSNNESTFTIGLCLKFHEGYLVKIPNGLHKRDYK